MKAVLVIAEEVGVTTTPLLRPSARDRGFTLVELLVVVIIVGVLAAIAIPVFLNQRKKAVDASIKSDMRNVITEVNAGMTADDDGDVWRVFIRGGLDPNTNQPAPGKVFLGNQELDLRIDKNTYLFGVYYGHSWSNTPEEMKGLCMTAVNRGGSQEWDGVDYGGWDYQRSVNYDSQNGWSRGRSSRCASIS